MEQAHKAGTGGDAAWTITLTPNPDIAAEVSIGVHATAARDNVGNTNPAFAPQTVTIDTVAPTVSSITGIPSAVTKDPFNIEITFSENVTGFEAGDITLFTHELGDGGERLRERNDVYRNDYTPEQSRRDVDNLRRCGSSRQILRGI